MKQFYETYHLGDEVMKVYKMNRKPKPDDYISGVVLKPELKNDFEPGRTPFIQLQMQTKTQLLIHFPI